MPGNAATVGPEGGRASHGGQSAMLVLTRKISESFVVGDDIKVTIIDIIGGNKVRVGIEAPQEVPVYREEIYELIKKENAEAARAAADPNRVEDL
jgi:carbon storage regulator